MTIPKLVPKSIFVDHHNFFEIQQNGTLIKSVLNNKPHGNFSFQAKADFITQYQIYQAVKCQYKPKVDSFDPEIVFLGTNSSQPTNVRNVSSIFVNMPSFGMLMDCGEGTYFQLLSHFGSEKIDGVLLNLKIIYISHFHLDHCMGITEILLERNKILKKMSKNIENHKVFLVVPPNLLPSLEEFNTLNEEIKDGVCYVLTSHLSFVGNQPQNYNSSILTKQTLEADELTMDEFFLQPELKSILGTFLETCFLNLKIFQQFLHSIDLSFHTISTPHCQDSHALIVKHKNAAKIVYSGDTKYCEDLIREGKNATILIHEATFLQKDTASRHSTIIEAIKTGRNMNAWRTVLTHFSKGSYNLDPRDVVLSSVESNNDKGLENYAGEQVILAVDHMRAKLSEFEYLPAINKCMKIIHPEGEW